MPQTEADTGQRTAGESQSDSVRQLPDEAFRAEDVLMAIGSELPPEPVVKNQDDEAGQPDAEAPKEEAPAAPETEPAEEDPGQAETPSDEEAPAETGSPADTSGFDADAWALAAGVDRDLLRGCKGEREALDVVAKRLVHQQALYGRLSNEVGRYRQEAGPGPSEAPDTPTAAAAHAEAQAALSEEELTWYQEQYETNPIAATRWLMQNYGQDVIRSVVDEAVRAERHRMEAEGRQRALDAERDAFYEKHPEARGPQAREAMLQGYVDVGHDNFPFSEAWDLATLREEDPVAYRDVVDMMRDGVGLATAKRCVQSERAAALKGAEAATATAQRAEDVANRASAAKRVPAGAGEGKHVPRVYGSVRELPDEFFDGEAVTP